jgi:hypothetical protein
MPHNVDSPNFNSRKAGNRMTFYLPIVLMIVGTTTYHIAQKSVPTQVNPLFSLAINDMTALAGTLLLIPFYPQRTAVPWSTRCEPGSLWPAAVKRLKPVHRPESSAPRSHMNSFASTILPLNFQRPLQV